MNLLFILIGIGLAIFVILVSYRSINSGIKAKMDLTEKEREENKTKNDL